MMIQRTKRAESSKGTNDIQFQKMLKEVTRRAEMSDFLRTFAGRRTNRMILLSEVKMEVKEEVNSLRSWKL